MEEVRQREANMTALQAIGPRKKPRLDGSLGDGSMAAPVSNKFYLIFLVVGSNHCNSFSLYRVME